MSESKGDHELQSPPWDSVASLQFSPVDPTHLLASSWDMTLRLYDVSARKQRVKFDHKAAVLGCAFSPDGKMAFSGGLDTWVRQSDLQNQTERVLGQHDETINAVLYSKETNVVITGAWDKTVRLWDPRGPPSSPVGTETMPERVYKMDITGTTLVVGLAARQFHIFDVRKMGRGSKPMQERESSLKYMTRALACMSNGQGYATASVEGRISVEYFDQDPEVQAKKYAFKCHRQAVDGEDRVWPVNALAFHPRYNTFASAGADGTVSIWDHTAKKRLRQYPRYELGVADIAFNVDGSKLAVGVSYGWEKGEEGGRSINTAKIFVKDVGDEVKPKNRQ